MQQMMRGMAGNMPAGGGMGGGMPPGGGKFPF